MTSPGEPRSLNSPGGQYVTGSRHCYRLPIHRYHADGLPAPVSCELCFQFVEPLAELLDHVLDVLQGDLSALQAAGSDRVLLHVLRQVLRFLVEVVVQPLTSTLSFQLDCEFFESGVICCVNPCCF